MLKKTTFVLLFIFTNLSIAAPLRFDFLFEQNGGTAQATGYIVFESTLLPNPGFGSYNIPDNTGTLLDLYVVVSGSSSANGNGIFTLNDFVGVEFSTGQLALDFSNELVGQPTDTDPWGTPSNNGKSNNGKNKAGDEFNPFFGGQFTLFTNQNTKSDSINGSIKGRLTPPFAAGQYTLRVGGAGGELMQISSFIVPQAVVAQPIPTLNQLSVLLIALTLLVMGLFTFKSIKQ